MYNFLPVRVKQCDGLRIFKRELKEYILNTYNMFNCIDFTRFFVFNSDILFYILYLEIAEKSK